jgi:hypothetical protein
MAKRARDLIAGPNAAPSATAGGLVGGGGGGHHNRNRNRGPNLPTIPEGFYGSIDMNKHKFKNLNRGRQNRMIGAYTTGTGGGGDDETTGIGGTLFNDENVAIQGAQGLLAQGGIPMQSGSFNQDEFMQNQTAQDYNEFVAYQTSTPGMSELTWSQFLVNKYGPDPAANMARTYRDSMARAAPEARGYFSSAWRGPGRTITG